MTEKVAELTEFGISTLGIMSAEEAEQLLQVLPELIKQVKERRKVKLQLDIAKAEDHVIKLRQQLEALQ